MRKQKSRDVVSPTPNIFSVSAWEAVARPLLFIAGVACAGLGAAIFHLLQRTKPLHWRKFLTSALTIAFLYAALHFWAALAADASVAFLLLRIAKLVILTMLFLTIWFAVPRLLELSDRERLLEVNRNLQRYIDEKNSAEQAVKVADQDRHAAQEEERKFKFLSDNANDAHFLVNRESRIVYANRIACEMLGHPLTDLTQMSISQIDLLFDRERFESFFDPSEKSHVALFEASFVRNDRTTFPVEVGLSRLEYGGETYLFSVARDITERKIVEESLKMHAEELARSNRELEQFAYISSHDLKEPLRMVTVYVQLLQKQLEQHGPLDENIREYLGFAVQGSRRMLSLIDDLLAYSRVGKDLGPFVEVDTNEIIRTTLDSLRAAIDEAGGTVEAPPLPEVLGHAGQLGQLFENLVANALKFRDPARAPRIQITAESQGDYWVFSVRDNGIGVHSRYLKRIFVIFQRLHTVQKYPGTGIGLSICKKIVENHGGTIWVESRLGEGSVFSFSLPKARQSKAPLTRRPTLVVGQKGQLDVSLA